MAETVDLSTRLQSGTFTGKWALAPDQTTVAFRSSSLWGLVKVKGRFTDVHGEAAVDPSGAITGRLDIDVASVSTGNAKRDTHLKSTDFFDAATHNHITFLATDVSVTGGDRVQISGELTIAGQSHPFAWEATVSNADDTGVTLTSSVVIDRSQWGIAWRKMGMTKMETGIDLKARFVRA